MKIGRQDQRSSGISTSNADTIVVRGRDLAAELVGTITFTEHFWLLLTGALPSPAQRRVLDATLVAIAEHGMVPSVQAARMTLAAAPEALQGPSRPESSAVVRWYWDPPKARGGSLPRSQAARRARPVA